ncbi:MAG: T9SS type A sorting domain-containing protein [Ignavibacteria bacterium]|nr:T9SS type A sorting domain-containing protein [Ignavibacteria bacterium]MBI3766299.1 T9SS type A sorting domain-containing protein [Ignavibacteriales bacterium]
MIRVRTQCMLLVELVVLVFIMLSVQSKVIAQPTNVVVGHDNSIYWWWNPTIAVNPNDSSKLAVGSEKFNNGEEQLHYSYSVDGGASWTEYALGYNPHGSFSARPQVAFAANNGEAWYAFVSYDTANKFDKNGIFAARSVNNGATWPDLFTVVDHNSPSGGTDFEDEVTLATGSTNGIFTAWTKKFNNGTKSQICYATDTYGPSGLTFTTPLKISYNDAVDSKGPSIVVRSSGYVYVLWFESGGNIRLNLSTDRLTFSSGASAVIQGISEVNSITIGNSTLKVNSYPSCAIDRTTDYLYMAWADNRTGGPNIYFASSQTYGTGYDFTGPLRRLNNVAGKFWAPRVSVSPDGKKVYVAYYGVLPGDTTVNVFVAASADRGKTFTHAKVSSATSTLGMANPRMGDYIGIAATNKMAYPVWTDRRTDGGGVVHQWIYLAQHSTILATIDQIFSSGDLTYDTPKRWNGSSFTGLWNTDYNNYSFTLTQSQQAIFAVNPTSTEVLRGTQDVLGGVSGSEKYNRWNTDPDVVNHHAFPITAQTNTFRSNFKSISSYSNANTIIRNELIDAPAVEGGTIKFKDPWLIDFNDPSYGSNARNQGGSAPRNPLGSPFKLRDHTTDYKGVFLGEEPDPNKPLKPFYEVEALSTQPIGGFDSYFIKWIGIGADVPLGGASGPVIFRDPVNLMYAKAQYKAHLGTSTLAALSPTGQRRVVQTTTGIHVVYESAGTIFYTYGFTWPPETVVGDYPTSTIIYRNPALVGDSVGVTVSKLYDQVQYPDLSVGIHTIFWEKSPGNVLQLGYFSGDSSFQSMPVGVMTKPQTGPTVSSIFAAVWCDKDVGLKYGVSAYPFNAFTNLALTPGVGATNPTFAVTTGPGPDGGKGYLFYLAWEVRGSTGGIKYMLGYLPNSAAVQASNITWYGPFTVASNSSILTNARPSLAVDVSNRVTIAWEYRDVSISQGNIKVQQRAGTTLADVVYNYTFSNCSGTPNYPYSPTITDYRSSSTKGNDFALVWYSANNGTSWAQYHNTWSLPGVLDATGRQASITTTFNSQDDRYVEYVDATGPPFRIKNIQLPSISPDLLPAPMLSCSACAPGTNPTLSWTTVAGALSYQLWRYSCPWASTECQPAASLIFTGPNTSYTDHDITVFQKTSGNLTPTSVFSYYVAALDNFCQSSPNSNIISVNSGSGPVVTKQRRDGNEGNELPLPTETRLNANYPNPFNPVTTISYQLATPALVRMGVYNVLGEEVAHLVEAELDAGFYNATWDAGSSSSGIYYVRMNVTDGSGKQTYQATKKLLLMK